MGARDLVLGEGLDGPPLVEPVVERVSDAGQELREALCDRLVLVHEPGYLLAADARDVRHAARPLGPVDLGAAPPHDLGSDGAGERRYVVGLPVERKLRGRRPRPRFLGLPDAVLAGRPLVCTLELRLVEHLHLNDALESAGVVEVAGVDDGVEALVVGAEGAHHVPDHPVVLGG